jgi:hypothetical protein
MKQRATIVAMILLISSVVAAGQVENNFSLKENCGKLAKLKYESEYGNGESVVDNQVERTSDYQSHYNKKMNTCMMLTSTNIKIGEDMGNKILLQDIIENKEYGTIVIKPFDKVMMCFVNGKTYKSCKSLEEWEKLIKPYMNE